MTLVQALQSASPYIGEHFEKLGKADSFFRSKYYLSYHEIRGWSVQKYNIFWRSIRFIFQCYFENTHLKKIAFKLSEEQAIPKVLKKHFQTLWQRAYPSEAVPHFQSSEDLWRKSYHQWLENAEVWKNSYLFRFDYPPKAYNLVAYPPKDYSSEWLKVCTFALELSNNIDTLDDCYSELLQSFKSCVVFFLEIGGFDKKLSFNDFYSLLDLLKNHTELIQVEEKKEKFSLILEKHFGLLNLQDRISKTKRLSTKPPSKIKQMIAAGLIVPSLLQTSDRARQLGLKPFPAMPKATSFVNLYSTINTINLLDKHSQEAGRWIFQHMRIVKFKELCQSIKHSLTGLRHTILNFESYYLLTIENKSQQWMADIAYRFLPPEKMPDGVLCVGKDGVVSEQIETCMQKIFSSFGKNFIMFDDISYSGTQLCQYIYELSKQSENFQKSNEVINLYFVYGFTSRSNAKKINDFIEKTPLIGRNVKIYFVCSHFIKNLSEVIEEEQLESELVKKIESLCMKLDKSLVITEWKKPDFISTPTFLTEGYIHNNGEWSQIRSAKVLCGVGPIDDIPSPYKRDHSRI